MRIRSWVDGHDGDGDGDGDGTESTLAYLVHTSDNTPHHLLVLPRPILSNQV